ncbi:MAG: hypothetical protein JSS11_06840 [Verrucomicrobia bacterium]|nr:hypothetical protein [Verrucomicrobiota bacterium]
MALALAVVAHAAPQRTLLLEVADVPKAEQVKGGRFFYGDYDSSRIIQVVRNRALLLATPEELAELRQAGYAPKVLFESTDRLQLYRRAEYGPEMKLSPVYWRYDQILKKAAALARAYPNLITRFQIGETQQEHRPIYAFRISNQAAQPQDRPKVLFDGVHHADELMGAQIVTALMEQLVTGYGRDKAVTAWLDTLEIYLVPVVNVDGHHVVTSGHDPRWRKNTHDVNGDGVTGVYPEGVDPNRNYNFNWAMGGTDNKEGSSYRGPYPFSESEIRAMRDLAEQVHPTLAVSYHSQGEVIYYPWSWGGKASPDDAVIARVAKEVASHLVKMDGSGPYAVSPGGPSSQSYAWYYGHLGIVSMIIETGLGAHVLPPEEVAGIVQTNLQGARALLAQAAGPGLSLRVKDAATGAPLQAEVWLPRIDDETIDRRTSDATFGRVHRLLNPGEYYVVVSRPGYATQVLPAVKIGPAGWTAVEVALTKN